MSRNLGPIILLSAGVLLAQTTGTGASAGTVTDSTGALMVNASVTVTNVATSFVSKTVTSAEGDYYILKITNHDHPITKGVNDFVVTDEQHFLAYEKHPKHLLKMG